MTGAIAFTIAVIELPAFLGLLDYGRLFPANRVEPFLGRHDRHDSELLRLHPPYLHEVGTTQGDLIVSTNTHVSWAPWYDYDVRYDAHGFRNQADRHGAEVAVIGDSFVEGVQVPFHDLMTTVLERHLGTSVKANLGQIGYVTAREELTIPKRFAAPLRPSTCVWCIFEGNDLADLRNPDRHGPTCTVRHSLGERSFVKNALLATIRLAGLDRSRYDDFMARSGIVPRPGGSNRRMFFFYPGHPVSDDDRQALKDLGGILDRA